MGSTLGLPTPGSSRGLAAYAYLPMRGGFLTANNCDIRYLVVLADLLLAVVVPE